MPKLFMLLIGCKPKGRNTEQHDVMFAIGNSLKDVVPQVQSFWADAGTIHLDAWREVNAVDGFEISVKEKSENTTTNSNKLFFLNLGGYKQHEFEEFHYKMLAVSTDKSNAIAQSKQTAFYKHTGFKGAESHIDDKYGVDVDDVFQIVDILPSSLKDKYQLHIAKDENLKLSDDEIHLGYFQLKHL